MHKLMFCTFIFVVLLLKYCYSLFSFKFRCHGNQEKSEIKFYDTVRFAIFENYILKPKITNLSYTQPKLWLFK